MDEELLFIANHLRANVSLSELLTMRRANTSMTKAAYHLPCQVDT